MPLKIPELSIEDFDLEHFNSGHSVKYALYFDERKLWALPSEEIESKLTIIKHVCFAAAPAEINNDENIVNRLIYYIDTKMIKGSLSDDEMLTFLKIAKRNKAIPSYININTVVKHKKFVLILDKQLPKDMLYVYLTIARCLQEETGVVRNMNVLCTKYRMPFELAWTVTSALSISNSWHNFIGTGRSYGNKNVLANKVNVSLAKALTSYMIERTKEMEKCAKNNETIVGYDQNMFGSQYTISEYIDAEHGANHLFKAIRDVANEKMYKYCRKQ